MQTEAYEPNTCPMSGLALVIAPNVRAAWSCGVVLRVGLDGCPGRGVHSGVLFGWNAAGNGALLAEPANGAARARHSLPHPRAAAPSQRVPTSLDSGDNYGPTTRRQVTTCPTSAWPIRACWVERGARFHRSRRSERYGTQPLIHSKPGRASILRYWPTGGGCRRRSPRRRRRRPVEIRAGYPISRSAGIPNSL